MSTDSVVLPNQPARSSDLCIHLLGVVEIIGADGPLEFKSKKEQWLLALLALNAGKGVDRGWLASTLWPDSETSLARYYLRRALSDLNSDLGPERARIESATYRTICLDLRGAYCDVAAFDDLVRRGDAEALKQAVALYRGPLLVECVEEWVLPVRVAREQAYIAALDTLASQALTLGAWMQAAGYARQLIASDPYHEAAYRTLMQALASAGNGAEAMRTYRDLRLLLHGELNVDPDAATQAVYQQIRLQAQQEPSAAGTETGRISNRKERRSAPADPSAPPVIHLQPLPHPLTSLLGREEARRDAIAMLKTSRLVTLTGPGGIGKTRLALDIAHHLSGSFQDGIAFVDLAAVSAPEMLPLAVAEALGVKEEITVDLTTTLARHLAKTHTLLLFDNCEHLIDGCARLIQTLLQAAPRLQALATSRQLLNIPGEHVFQVAALDVPPDTKPDTVYAVTKPSDDSPLNYSSVQLFVERAREANAFFQPTRADFASIARICRRLDGIALAIELAAARTRSLSVEQIDARLKDRFLLLTTGSRAALPRQQTLRALIDWSYALLDEEEKRLFASLALFAGGCTLEAVEQVCSSPGPDSYASNLPKNDLPNTASASLPLQREQVLDLLSTLIDRSLVMAEEREGSVRYRMLETIREYALERLKTLPEYGALSTNYIAYLNDRLWQSWHLPIEEGVAWVAADYANLLSALEMALADPGGSELALSLACGLERFWHVRAYFRHGAHYLRLAYGHPGASQNSEMRAKCLLSLANMARLLHRLEEAESLFLNAITLLEKVDHPGHLVRGLSSLSYVYVLKGEFEKARAVCGRALELAQSSGSLYSEAFAQTRMAYIMRELGDLETAYSSARQALQMALETDQPRLESEARNELGLIHLARNECDAALSCFAATLKHYQAIGSKGGIAEALNGIALVAMQTGRFERARASLHESLHLLMEIDYRSGILECIEECACLSSMLGFSEDAALMLGWCSLEREDRNLAPPRAELTTAAERLSEILGPDRFAALILCGKSLERKEVAQIALRE